jgi:hypothetical protein
MSDGFERTVVSSTIFLVESDGAVGAEDDAEDESLCDTFDSELELLHALTRTSALHMTPKVIDFSHVPTLNTPYNVWYLMNPLS